MGEGGGVGASLLLAVNLTLGFAVMGILTGVVLYDRSQKSALWWLASCGTAVMAGACMFALPHVQEVNLLRFAIFTLFAISSTCLAVGLAVRYAGAVSWRPFAAALLASMAAFVLATEFIADLGLRRAVYQLPFAGIQLVGLIYVVRGMRPQFIDRAVAFVVGLSAAQFPVKSALAYAFSGPSLAHQDLLSSPHMAASLAVTAMIWIILSMLLGTRMIIDMLDQMKAKSAIDPLSGLLNRQGFVNLVEHENVLERDGDVPSCLIVCDLDHFKQINDVFGHPAGDRVIKSFGEAIQTMANEGDIAARIGGEEFCVLLRHTDMIGAHLFAEALRTVFSTTIVSGFPEDKRLTASFGVTEIERGEDFEKAFSRADSALYDAKNRGRDQVAIRTAEDDEPETRLPQARSA